jgi:hypothetical protein
VGHPAAREVPNVYKRVVPLTTAVTIGAVSNHANAHGQFGIVWRERHSGTNSLWAWSSPVVRSNDTQ